MLGRGGIQCGFNVAHVLVAIADEHQPSHRIVAERGQSQLQRAADIRAAAALFVDRLGIAEELGAGDGIDPGIIGKADDTDAVVFLFVFLIRNDIEIFLARRIVGIAGELCELIDRIADIAADDHLDILVLPLPARPAEDENEAERHEQP